MPAIWMDFLWIRTGLTSQVALRAAQQAFAAVGGRCDDDPPRAGAGTRSTLMKMNPYLSFDGRCREAFEFYATTLGGRISFLQTVGETPMAAHMPPEGHGRVMHVTMEVGDQVLQGADAPPGQFSQPAGFCVALHFDEPADGERVFSALAQHGTVQMPFQATFWAKGFGMLIDQFGTPWIVNAGQMVGS